MNQNLKYYKILKNLLNINNTIYSRNTFLDLDGNIVEEINDENIKEKFDKIISLVEKSY